MSSTSTFDKINSYDLFAKGVDGEPTLSSGHVCLKRTIIAVNIFFLILGIIMTAVGSAATSNEYADLAGDSLPVGIMVLGIFIMIISLFGCCGAKRESRVILGFYAVVLSILIICQLGVGIAVYVKQDKAPEMIRSGWDSSTNGIRVIFQNQLDCCGLEIYNKTAPLVPTTDVTATQGLAGQPCPDPITRPTSKRPCMTTLLTKLQSSYTTAGIVAIVFAFLQILGFMFALCLIRGIRLSREADQQA
eukprot:TRINITY_DN2092_c0_g2_i1.p1 TRINITY_DN2092_c0_g2~~TRINITY_DN2092_c0_g2_i1.p1  ORF type:complete len:247 (-),score=98.07 TRINITY_DN2092_c0_g2_i1:117-857(-)